MRPTDAELYQLAESVGQSLTRHGQMLASAESCTGGWLGMIITAVPGSSAWFERGFITYSNQAKQDLLGVQAATLDSSGAVSEATVLEMARGALLHSAADIALAISGIAGPGGGTPKKPVGTVCIAWAQRDGTQFATTCRMGGDRDEIRARAVAAALRGVIELLG
jgi:nicotinamide-nucleotide amidase